MDVASRSGERLAMESSYATTNVLLGSAITSSCTSQWHSLDLSPVILMLATMTVGKPMQPGLMRVLITSGKLQHAVWGLLSTKLRLVKSDNNTQNAVSNL